MKPFLSCETRSTRQSVHEETATLPLGGNERSLLVEPTMGLHAAVREGRAVHAAGRYTASRRPYKSPSVEVTHVAGHARPRRPPQRLSCRRASHHYRACCREGRTAVQHTAAAAVLAVAHANVPQVAAAKVAPLFNRLHSLLPRRVCLAATSSFFIVRQGRLLDVSHVGRRLLRSRARSPDTAVARPC